jgi:hypothetical protein
MPFDDFPKLNHARTTLFDILDRPLPKQRVEHFVAIGAQGYQVLPSHGPFILLLLLRDRDARSFLSACVLVSPATAMTLCPSGYLYMVWFWVPGL